MARCGGSTRCRTNFTIEAQETRDKGTARPYFRHVPNRRPQMDVQTTGTAKPMNRLLFILLAIAGIAIATILVAPGLIPAETYKGRIEAAASQALGRQVTISNDISVRIFPTTAFAVNDLAIANEEGFEGDTLVRVKSANIGVKLFPLLSQSVEIDRFILTEPAINLMRNADGSVNWNLAHAGADAKPETARDTTGSAPRNLALGDVRVIDGRATYRDRVGGKTYALEDIDLRVVLKSLDEPLEVDGDLVFQGEPSVVDIVLTDLNSYLAGEDANLKLDMVIGDTTAGADLTVRSGDGLAYSGPIDFNAPDLPAFAALTGTSLADAPGFDRLNLKGNVEGGATAMRLSGADITFDQIDAQGTLNLDWSGAKPRASGVLASERLDLRPYMPPPVENAAGFPEWSTAKMDFAALNNINAEFDLSTDETLLNDLKFGESRLIVNIVDGRMTADIPELAMYGGQGSGRVVVNARNQTPSFAGNFDMSAVEAQPLAIDLMKHDNLLGLGGFKLDFTATGASQAAIMSSIDGSGGFDIANGALKGINIAKIAQAAASLQSGGINPAALANAVATARGPREETDFSEFLSNFTIENGLMNAPTISLNGPYLTMTGQGQVNLAAQTIDLRLAPRATSTADGAQGRAIAVPVRIGGTFAKPTVGVDAEALAKAALQNSLGGFLGSANATPEDAAANAIRGILGGGAKQPEEDTGEEGDAAEETETSPEEALIKEGLGALFGRKKEEPAEEDDSSE